MNAEAHQMRRPSRRARRSRGVDLVHQAIDECDDALRVLEVDYRTAYDLFLLASRTLYIAESVGWTTHLDRLRNRLTELSAALSAYEFSASSSPSSSSTISGGTSAITIEKSPVSTR